MTGCFPGLDLISTDKHEPALFDVDRDGKPGISIRSGMFKVYGAFRFRLALLASMIEEGVFAGESLLEVDPQIYGVGGQRGAVGCVCVFVI
jgi:hypothetical protein